MKGKHAERSNSGSPGPIYDTIRSSDAIKQSFPKIKIGNAKRLQPLKKEGLGPGPGGYETTERMSSTFYSSGSSIIRQSFPRAKRGDLVLNAGYPGPSDYNLLRQFDKPSSLILR